LVVPPVEDPAFELEPEGGVDLRVEFVELLPAASLRPRRALRALLEDRFLTGLVAVEGEMGGGTDLQPPPANLCLQSLLLFLLD
jgi:hypothetical protein